MGMNGRRKFLISRHQRTPHCYYCGFETWRTEKQAAQLFCEDEAINTKHLRHAKFARQATVEHLTPKTEGGRDSVENFTIACKWCNTARGHGSKKKFEEFIEYMITNDVHPHQIYDRSGVFMQPRFTLFPFSIPE